MIDIDLGPSICCVVGAAYEKKPTFPASSGVQTGEARARATVNHARVGDLTVALGCRARRAPTGACAVVQKATVTSRRAPLRAVPRGGPGCGGRGGEHVLFLQLPKHMGSHKKGVQIPKRGI